MSITIDLPAPILTALQEEANATGQPVEQIAVDTIVQRFSVSRNGVGSEQDQDDEDELTDEEIEEIVAAGREALEDIKAGRLLTLDEVGANVRAAIARAQEEQERSHAQVSAG